MRQFWLNTLLGQSCATKEREFSAGGRCVVMACRDDTGAREATALVRAELNEPDAWLSWAPYEDFVAVFSEAEREWATAFRARYLDFRPVREHLSENDPRRRGYESLTGAERTINSLSQLMAMAQRVTGEGSVLAQIVDALASEQDVPGRDIDLLSLALRADELTLGLKVLRQAAAGVWGGLTGTPSLSDRSEP